LLVINQGEGRTRVKEGIEMKRIGRNREEGVEEVAGKQEELERTREGRQTGGLASQRGQGMAK